VFEVSVLMDFSSAHNLKGYRGRCEELHGHNWKVEVVLGSDSLDKIGMVEDFKIIKEKLKEVLALLDHKYLNDTPYFKDANPTSENIAKFIYEQMQQKLQEGGKKLLFVRVWETEGSSAIYRK